MNERKFGFSMLEVLLVLMITSLLVVCIAPLIVKRTQRRGIVEKVTCTQGGVVVVQNNFSAHRNQTADSREGTIELPPGVTSFYLTMSGGGAGGGATFIDENSNDENGGEFLMEAGGGGGGAGYFYKVPVNFVLPVGVTHATLTYRIGGGGAGATDSKHGIDAGTGEDTSDGDFKFAIDRDGDYAAISLDDSTNGGNSILGVLANGTELLRFEANGGRVAHGAVSTHGVGQLRRVPAAFDPALNFFAEELGMTRGYSYAGTGGDTDVHCIGACGDYADVGMTGENGEPGYGLLPGLGGASVFGSGSFGSGGAGGMEAVEKRFNVKRGQVGFRRCGEDGIGGILIIEYDAVCTTLR